MLRSLLVWSTAAVLLAAGCQSRTDRRASLPPPRADRAPAAPPASSPEPLPTLDADAALEDYLAYAAMNNPGLEAAFHRWQAGLQRVPRARALPDPRITYRYYIREVETRVGPQRHGLGVAQTVPWPGKLRERAGVATEAAEAARRRYEAEKVRLFHRVKVAWYEYAYLARAIDTVREIRELIAYLESVARRRYTARAAEHPDVLRAQVELGKLDDRLRTLRDLRPAAAARLNAALARSTLEPTPWPALAAEPPLEVADEALLAWLAESNPELAALDAEIRQAGRAVDLARQAYYPDVTVGLDWIPTDDPPSPARPRDAGRDPVVAMLSVNVPIWHETYAAGVREAEHRRLAAVRTRAERAHLLSSEARMALYAYRDAARKADLYGDALVPKARQGVAATQTAFVGGTANFVDLVDAERQLLEFRLSHQRALADQGVALARLEMLVGRTLPRGAPPAEPDEGDAP